VKKSKIQPEFNSVHHYGNTEEPFQDERKKGNLGIEKEK